MPLVGKLRNLPRSYKSLLLVFNDLLLLPLSVYLACYLGTGNLVLSHSISPVIYLSLPVVTGFVFLKFGLYRAIVRFLGYKVIFTIGLAVSFSSLLFIASAQIFHFQGLPARVYLINWLLSIVFIGGSRFVARQLMNAHKLMPLHSDEITGVRNVAVYGTGSIGVQLAKHIRDGKDFQQIVFIDDDIRLTGREIDGVRVVFPDDLPKLCKEYGIEEVYLAVPGADNNKRRSILEKLSRCSVKVRTIPSFSDLVSGVARVDELREINVDDLLGRSSVLPKRGLIEQCVIGKSVLVTGAGGSIGSELCRQIISLKPSILVLFELSEYALYKVEAELNGLIKESCSNIEIVGLLGSVQHKKRLLQVMRAYDIQTVYHAAAYKHVPIVEHNPIEGVRNNIFGTLNVVLAANESGVETFTLVSTDKAVRPKNVMGATKRFAEMILQGVSQTNTKTKFCMVRFGNVLNSSGSVVPLFSKQIESKKPITLTHPEVTRYFMTIPEAAQLVLQAGTLANGGDVCVLDMGEPVRIIDLARKMISLSGYKEKTAESDGDVEIRIVGLRPGEKLYEELLIGDNVSGTEHPLIMRAEESCLSWVELQKIIENLDQCCHDTDVYGVRDILLSVVSGYVPQCDIQDKTWLAGLKKQGGQEKVIPFEASS